MKRSKAPTDGMPEPAEGPAGDFPSFLRVTDIGKGKLGAKGAITFLGKPGRKITSSFGVQYAFPVKIGKTVYDWPIKVDSGNHRRLFDKFGKGNPKGTVKVEIKEFNRNNYIAIV